MKRVESFMELWLLSHNRKSVIAKRGMLSCRSVPATFVMSMQARIVARLLSTGLYIYEPKPKEKKPCPIFQQSKPSKR